MLLANFSCRACNSSETTVLLDLGRLPLANAFVHENDTSDEFTENLTLVMCGSCSLIQLIEEIPWERLYGPFLLTSGVSGSAQIYGQWFSKRLKERHQRRSGQVVLELANYHGFFLELYRKDGFEVLGVDPSGFSDDAARRGLPAIRDFWTKALAEQIRRERGLVQIIVARNVLDHVSGLRDFLAGVQLIMAGSGVLVVESPYAFFLRSETQYDTVFHEHLSHFTIGSLANAIAQFGLKITDVSFVSANGGSILCEISHESSPLARADQSWIDFENLIALNRPSGWKDFARTVAEQRCRLTELLQELAAKGSRVAAYGAAAKCMTMLNYCGISRKLLPLIGDGNSRKQGLLCPGVRIPVVSPEKVMEVDPEYILIGASNFKDEIIRFFRDKMQYRNHFIVPLPVPRIVD